MSSIQEQMTTGFGQITRMLERSLNSQERSLSSQKNRSIEYIQVEDDEDEHDEQNIEEYIPENEDLHSLQEEAQKKYQKKHRKEIKVCLNLVYFYYLCDV